jgi:hypothetical protein
VFAVDHQANRFTPKVPNFTMDLSLEDKVTVANQMLEFVKPDAVHFGQQGQRAFRVKDAAQARGSRASPVA